MPSSELLLLLLLVRVMPCAYLSWMSTSCQGEATSVKAADDSEDISERHGGRQALLMSDGSTFPLGSASPDAEQLRLDDGLSETAVSHVTVLAVCQSWTSGAATLREEDGGVSRDTGCLVLPRLSTHQHYPWRARKFPDQSGSMPSHH